MLVDPVFTRIHGFGFESLQDLQAGAALLNWNGTVRETVTFMPQPLPLISSLKRWREENGFSQSEAVRVLNETGMAVTLDSLQNWEFGRWSPRANVALALADFLRQNPKVPLCRCWMLPSGAKLALTSPTARSSHRGCFPPLGSLDAHPFPSSRDGNIDHALQNTRLPCGPGKNLVKEGERNA
jgi:transcriptional regulator with XRE-family HTH domain